MNNIEEKKDILLPPPELLERYESIYKGMSKDLVKLVEKEQEHRHEMQNKYLMHFKCGQFFGGIFLTAIIFMIFCLILHHHYEMGLIMTAMFGLLIILILIQYRKDKNNAIMKKSMNNNRNNLKNNNNRKAYTQKREK